MIAPCNFTAVPHASAKEDSYKGYYIPKGAIVFGNSWSVVFIWLHSVEVTKL